MTDCAEELHEQYRKVFNELDDNSSGEVATEVVTRLFNKMGKDLTTLDLQNFLSQASASTSSQSTLNFDEFVFVFTHVDKAFVQEDEMFMVFQHFDKDGDGFISPKELRDLLNSMGDEVTEKELLEMMAEADKDGDGKVSYNEFVGVMSCASNPRKNSARTKSSTSEDSESRYVNEPTSFDDDGLTFEAECLETASTSNLVFDVPSAEATDKPLSSRRKSCFVFSSSLGTEMFSKDGIRKKDLQRPRSRSSCDSLASFDKEKGNSTPKKRLSLSASASFLKGIFRKKGKH